MGIEKASPSLSEYEASKDAEELTNIGHTEELRREFSIWSLGSLCLCLMGTVRFPPFPSSPPNSERRAGNLAD